MLGLRQANILVIKTDGLAAFVAAEPAFEVIRQSHPKARISLLTAPDLQRVARTSPYFDQVAAMPDLRDAESRKAFVKQLKSSKFERIYDLAADDAGRKLYAAMGMFRPKWFSANAAPRKNSKAKFTTHLPDLNQMLAGAGLEAPDRLPDFRWAMATRKDSANMQPSWYGISGQFGLLLPGDNPDHRWPASSYAEFANMMAQAGFMPVLAGPKDLHHFGDEIAHDAPQLVDLTGKTDHLQLAALAQEAAFFVSDDAAEMHLAVSVGCQGVLTANAKAPPAAPVGRHVVRLTATDDLCAIEPEFIWRTLSNMGLIVAQAGGPVSAQAR